MIGKSLAALVGVAVLAGGGLIWVQPWQPFSPAELSAQVSALLRYGAITVPQDMAGPDHPEAVLMQRVAAGGALNPSESTRYRQAMQAVLAENQTLFGLLDNNIVFADDTGPDSPNNCGSRGIAGHHDHHAASAVSNFAEMEQSLTALATAGPLGRIRHANRAYKSLTDLMVHLAPAQVSVMLADQPPLPPGSDPLRAAAYDRFRRAMTKAGFLPIGSPPHKAALAQAEAAFAELAMGVQSAVTARLGPLEQRLAGRWLALQSVSPRLTLPPA